MLKTLMAAESSIDVPMHYRFQIIIDRAVGAPGHGKDLVDALNAVDKRFLKTVMIAPSATPGEEEKKEQQFSIWSLWCFIAFNYLLVDIISCKFSAGHIRYQ